MFQFDLPLHIHLTGIHYSKKMIKKVTRYHPTCLLKDNLLFTIITSISLDDLIVEFENLSTCKT